MHDTAPALLAAAARLAQLAHQPADQRPRLADVLALLAEQAQWRVYIDSTRNLGHQASTVLMLRRLIDLCAFSGEVLVVYAEPGRAALGSTAAKLAMMFTGVDPRQLDQALAQHGSCRAIRFLRFERREQLREPVAFGFTGGADDMAVNYALELNVGFFARIQPYLWDDPPAQKHTAYYQSSRIEQAHGEHLYLLDALPLFQYLALNLSTAAAAPLPPSYWDWFAQQQCYDPGLRQRCSNLRAVLAARANHPAERARLWPIYGLQHFAEHSGELLFACVLCALRLQPLHPAPVLLCSFSPSEAITGWPALLTALASDLQTRQPHLPLLRHALLARYGSAQQQPAPALARLDRWLRALTTWLQQHAPGATVAVHRTYAEATGHWHAPAEPLGQALHAPGAAPVQVLELGTVAMDAFNHCLLHADLPAIVEGQAAANLLSVAGKPFLQLLRSEHVISNGYAQPGHSPHQQRLAAELAALARQLRDLHPARCLVEEPSQAPEAYFATLDTLALFFHAATTPGSDVSGFFQAASRHLAHETPDKLLVALLAMGETMLADAGE